MIAKDVLAFFVEKTKKKDEISPREKRKQRPQSIQPAWEKNKTSFDQANVRFKKNIEKKNFIHCKTHNQFSYIDLVTL